MQTNQKSVEKSNCISCHMTKSGVTDIPHVSSTDHFIRKRQLHRNSTPPSAKELKLVFRNFTDTLVSGRNQALATIAYFETIDHNPAYLTEIARYINQLPLNHRAKYAYLTDKPEVAGPIPNVAESQTDPNTSFYYAGLSKIIGNNPLPFLEKAVQLAPDNLEYRIRLAESYSDADNLKAAQAEYEQVLNRNPFTEKALVNLGYCLLLQGNLPAAETYTARALQAYPDNRKAAENQVNIFIQAQKYKPAERALRDLTKKYPSEASYKNILKQLKSDKK